MLPGCPGKPAGPGSPSSPYMVQGMLVPGSGHIYVSIHSLKKCTTHLEQTQTILLKFEDKSTLKLQKI